MAVFKTKVHVPSGPEMSLIVNLPMFTLSSCERRKQERIEF